MTPWSIIRLTGGGRSLKMYAVVGRMTATEPAAAMASVPASEISSRCDMASHPNSRAPICVRSRQHEKERKYGSSQTRCECDVVNKMGVGSNGKWKSRKGTLLLHRWPLLFFSAITCQSQEATSEAGGNGLKKPLRPGVDVWERMLMTMYDHGVRCKLSL